MNRPRGQSSLGSGVAASGFFGAPMELPSPAVGLLALRETLWPARSEHAASSNSRLWALWVWKTHRIQMVELLELPDNHQVQ